MSVHKKIQLNRSSRLAGYRQHLHMNVLFYYKDLECLAWSLLISDNSSIVFLQSNIVEKPQLKIFSFQNDNHGYLTNT